jgi:hypothetical protein
VDKDDEPMIKVGQLYGCPKGEGTEFPIAFFEPHREQAYRNHSQSLERLAERGGLGWGEAIAILNDNDNRYKDVAENREWLRRRFEQWKRANIAAETPEPLGNELTFSRLTECSKAARGRG